MSANRLLRISALLPVLWLGTAHAEEGPDLSPDELKEERLSGAEIRLASPPDPLALRSPIPEVRWAAERIAAGRGDVRVMRAMHRYYDQFFPFDRVPPPDLLRRAVEAKRALEQNDAVPIPTGCWSWLGPTNIPGRMTALAPHPTDPNVIYAGGADGGVWKTSNGGQTWAALTDFTTSIAIGALAIDPANPNTVYAGLGEGNYSGDARAGRGVLKTTDGGATWVEIPVTSSYHHEMQVDPRDSNRVWGATRSGLFLSTDAGLTWAPPGGGLPVEDTTTVLVSRKPGSRIVLAGVGSGSTNSANSGVWRSTDNGTTWAAVAGPAAGGDTGRSVLGQAASDPDVVYVAFHENTADEVKSIWRSADEGATWTEVGGTAGCNGQCWYNFHMAVDAGDPNTLYLGLVGIFRSQDGGQTWQSLAAAGVHVDQHFFISPGPGKILIANDGGVALSSDQGNTWSPIGERLLTGQYYHGTIDPADDSLTVGGTQDNGTHRFSGQPSFQRVIGADGAWTAINWVDPQIWYGSIQYMSIRRSRDRGLTFSTIGTGIPNRTTEPRAFIAPFALDRGNPDIMYAGTTKLYRSMDQGSNFTAISPVLPAGSTRFIRSMDNCRDVPASIWVGTVDGKVWNTPDAGTTWNDVTGNLPAVSVTSIAVHPQDPNTAYVTLGSFGIPHVWKTTTGGTTWTAAATGLPDIVHRHVLVVPDQPNTLIVASDVGVFRSDDAGATWGVYGTDLPNVSVDWLPFSETTGTIRAATHGRGLWELLPAGTCPLPPDFTGIGGIQVVNVAGDCKPELSWSAAQPTCTAAPGIKYNVYRSTDPLFTPGAATLLQAGIAGTSYIDLTAASGIPYYYAVRSEDGQTTLPGPSNGGREDANQQVLFFSLGDPVTAGAFQDPAGDASAWMRSGYWSVDDLGNTTPAGRFSYRSAPVGSATHGADVCAAIETPDLVIGSAATLTYQASFNIEWQWDGVAVEISTDRGATWTDLAPAGGYPGDMSQTQGNACNFPANRGVFNGPSNNSGLTPWLPYNHDLASYAGQTARLRWLLSTDAGAEFEGFLLDDIRISPVASSGSGCGCTVPASTLVPNRLLATRQSGGAVIWVWTSFETAGNWNLHTAAAKTAIPTLFQGSPQISATVKRATDPGNFPLGFYQVYGADCTGRSVP